MKLNPRSYYGPLAAKYSIRGYPTVVLLRPDGSEAGRIVGYKPPEEFLRRVRELRLGTTLDRRLALLRATTGDHAELPAIVEGLRERGDALAALALIRELHDGGRKGCCGAEEWRTELALQAASYRDAGLWALGQRPAPPEVPDEPAVAMLASLLETGPLRDDVGALRRVLREARRIDTTALGERAPLSDLSLDAVDRCAQLLFDGGAYDGAARLWRRAEEAGVVWTGREYYIVAGKLCEAETYLQTADRFARVSLNAARRDGQPIVDETFLLAQILAAAGETIEAARMARDAAALAIATGRLYDAHLASDFARRCSLGESPSRHRPPFEAWPW